MKKSILFMPIFLTLCLSSCAGEISDLYDFKEYNDGVFVDNYYQTWAKDLTSTNEALIYNVNYYENLSSLKSAFIEKNDIKLFTQERENDFISRINKKEDGSFEDLIWTPSGSITSLNAPDGNEVYFGATHSLSYGRNGRSEFAKGITSKLFDGRVSCSGYKALSRMQLSESGCGFMLPLRLKSYEYCVFALRGASDIPNDGVTSSGLGTYATIDLNFTLYKKDKINNLYQPYSFVLENLDITVDNRIVKKSNGENVTFEGGSQTHCVSFFFEDAGIDGSLLQDACAMSLTYKLHDISGVEISTNPNEEGNHFALMLYEVMFPNAQWY